MRVLRCAATALCALLAGCFRPPLHCDAASAQEIVSRLSPDEHFRTMLRTVVITSPTANVAMVQYPGKFWSASERALNTAVAHHRAQWRENLVRSWESLPQADLKAACLAANARDERTMAPFRRQVGSEMQRRSSALLVTAAQEALASIYRDLYE